MRPARPCMMSAPAVAMPTPPAPTIPTCSPAIDADYVPFSPRARIECKRTAGARQRRPGRTLPRMARIEIPDGPGAPGRRVFGLRPEMAGTVTDMIDAVYHRSALPATEREVARLRVAQLNDCSACSTARAQSMLDAGVTENDYGHLDEWRTWPGYTERQRLAIEYAERFTIDHQGLDDEFYDRLRAQFADDEILDLSLCLAIWLGLGRVLAVLQVEQRTGVMADL